MKPHSMSREVAEDLITRLLALEFADDEDQEGEIIESLERGLVCPNIITLMFHTTPELSSAEIVDRALAYSPISL